MSPRSSGFPWNSRQKVELLIEKAKRILRNEGLPGLVERVKRRISRRFEKNYSAIAVTHQEGMKWFERRKEGYDALISAVCPYLRSDAVVFDVGANLGYFTFLLAKRLNFIGSAYLFEPVPHLAELCRTTFSQVPFDVRVFDFGLSDRDAEEDLFIAGSGNLGWNTLVSHKATSDMTKVRVQLRRFDSCGIEAIPSLVKIDVEGAEYRVLRGMIGSFRRWQPLPVVLCEVGWGHTHPAWAEELSVFAEIRRVGYTVYNLDGFPIDESHLRTTTDVLFLPEAVGTFPKRM